MPIDSSGLSYARPRHIKSDESRLINKSLSWQRISSRSRAAQHASWAKPAAMCETIRRRVRERPPGSRVHVYVYTQFLFFFCLFFSPRNLCVYECRYCSIKAELPCRRLHTPAGAGPQKVVPVTRCTLVTAGKARGGEGWQITMRASCQVARILIRLEGTWEEKRQTLRGLRTMRGVGTLDPCLPASQPQRNSRLIMPRTQIRQVSPRRAGKDTPCGESAETLPTHQVALRVG